jgi:hypothetical protein
MRLKDAGKPMSMSIKERIIVSFGRAVGGVYSDDVDLKKKEMMIRCWSI